MSSLIFIRHGQASFGSSNYDKLSEKGVVQARVLGAHFAIRALHFDAVFSGEQERQRHTLALVREAYNQAKLPFPEPTVLKEFNEYDAVGLMTHLYPRLLEKDRVLQEILEQTPNIGDASPEGRKAFQRTFEIVLHAWIDGSTKIKGLESWELFHERVIRGIEKLKADFPSGKTVAVFSSGGSISTAMGYALDLSNHKALDLQWVIKNSSLTEFMFSGTRFTLTGFNHTPHFVDESLVTYR